MPTQPQLQFTVNYQKYYERIRPFVEKRRNQSYTATILSFLAIALFGLYAVRPTIQTIIYLQREIADKTQVNRKMEEKIAALIEAQANYQAASERLALVTAALPDNPEATQLLSELKKLADATHASLSAVSVPGVPLVIEKTPQAKPDSKKQQVNFETTILVSGGYPAIKAFLDGIIELRRLVTIDGLTIALVKDEQQTESLTAGQRLRLTLRATTGYLKPASAKETSE